METKRRNIKCVRTANILLVVTINATLTIRRTFFFLLKIL